MSIHEVVYDTKGRIIHARCVDEEIRLATEEPAKVIAKFNGELTAVAINRHPCLSDGDTDYVSSDFPAYKIRMLTAKTPETVRDRESIIQDESEFHTNHIVLHDITYSQEEINQAHLKTERGRGFVWTKPGQQIDVYVAPPKPALRPSLTSRVRAAIGI